MSAAHSPPLLQIHDLTFAYPGEPPLARHWSARIGPGMTLVCGDTGSGKTALLRVIAGELAAAGGTLAVKGRRFDGDREAWRRHVFFCDPAAEDLDAITARACTAAFGSGDAAFDAAEWSNLAAGFALEPHLDKPMHMLSTGSRRKVGLAAALASGRTLALLDEPTAGLDAASTACLHRALARRAAQRSQALIVATSDDKTTAYDGIGLAATITLPLA